MEKKFKLGETVFALSPHGISEGNIKIEYLLNQTVVGILEVSNVLDASPAFLKSQSAEVEAALAFEKSDTGPPYFYYMISGETDAKPNMSIAFPQLIVFKSREEMVEGGKKMIEFFSSFVSEK